MTKEAVHPPQKFQGGYHTFWISKKDLPQAGNFLTGAGGQTFATGKVRRAMMARSRLNLRIDEAVRNRSMVQNQHPSP